MRWETIQWFTADVKIWTDYVCVMLVQLPLCVYNPVLRPAKDCIVVVHHFCRNSTLHLKRSNSAWLSTPELNSVPKLTGRKTLGQEQENLHGASLLALNLAPGAWNLLPYIHCQTPQWSHSANGPSRARHMPLPYLCALWPPMPLPLSQPHVSPC